MVDGNLLHLDRTAPDVHPSSWEQMTCESFNCSSSESDMGVDPGRPAVLCSINKSLSYISHIQSLSKERWLIRPEFHIPCVILSIAIIILYVLELRVVLRYRRHAPFTSTYFRVWTMQATADLTSLFCYLIFSFSRNITSTWNFWLYLNRTSIPTLIIIINGAVILSQMTGVAMASVNRYLKLCMPTSSITAKFDATSTVQLAVIVVLIPVLVSIMILYNVSPIFVYNDGHSSVIAPCFRRPGKLVYSIVAPIWCITTLFTSTICYSKIISRLSSMSYLKRRDLKTERMLTMLSMPVFISLWLVFLYYSFIAMAILLQWVSMYDMLFAYYHLINLILSVTNPLSALFSRDIRRRILFQNYEFSQQRHTFLS